MSEAKHTPGPWVVDKTVTLGAYGVWTGYATHPGHDGAGYPSHICSMKVAEGAVPREQRDANAHLIAAAPDLLEACVSMLSIADKAHERLAAMFGTEDRAVVSIGERITAARAAINKATKGGE